MINIVIFFLDDFILLDIIIFNKHIIKYVENKDKFIIGITKIE